MSWLAKGVAALVLAMCVAVSPARAQAEFAVGGGVGLPLGDFGDVSNVGWHGLAAVSFVPTGSPVGIQVDGQFHRFGVDNDVVGAVGDNFRFLVGTANAVYRFQTSEETKFRPYLIGGVGFYNGKVTGDNINVDSNTDFGINGGAGFDFNAGNASLFVEGRFHNIFSDPNNSNFIPITLGVRFGGGR
ncbi:MAG: outer membrane beta-barrel protein [Gemmatimonadales bacterium]